MIKHYAYLHAIYGPEDQWYLCNQAVKPTPEKLVYNWDKVTCKNCLRMKHYDGRLAKEE